MGRAGAVAHGRRVARSWAACGSPPARSVARRPVPPAVPWHRPPSRPARHGPACSKVLAAVGKEVKEFFGGNHSQAVLSQTTGVIVCTIEKANIM